MQRKSSFLKELWKYCIKKVTSKESLMRGNSFSSIVVMCMGCFVMLYFVMELAFSPNNIAYANENIPIVEEFSDPEENKTENEIWIPDTLLSPVIEVGMTRSVSVVSDDEYDSSAPDKNMWDYNTTVYIAYQGGVNIRSIPSTDGEILGTYCYRDSVDVVKRGDEWLKTSDGNYIYENATSTEEPPLVESVGSFKITAYCSCSKCCGKNAAHGLTRTGTRPEAGRTISVDPKVIPLGSKVTINGHDYIAEDTGSAIHGNIIDMYFDTHQEAKQFGVQHAEIYIYR